MSGILKDVQYLDSLAIEDMFHPINMLFIKPKIRNYHPIHD